MYNIKGPSKIVAKTARRGISQGIEPYRDHNKNKIIENDDNDTPNNVPKPVFQKKLASASNRHEQMTPEHIELVKYMHGSWTAICQEFDQENEDDPENGNCSSSIPFYTEEPSEQLQDFKPFDLESWWGKRLYAHITASTDVSNEQH